VRFKWAAVWEHPPSVTALMCPLAASRDEALRH